MAVVNESFHISPVEEKNGYTIHLRQRKLLRDVKDHNKTVKKHVSKECHNCSHYLSKYYYWKLSPCEACSRSPSFYYRLSKSDLIDNWEPTLHSPLSRTNILRH